jgi:hypothetical protein
MNRIRLLFVLILLLSSLSLLPSVAQAQGDDQPTAEQMLAALNEWRLSADLQPFRPNSTLTALAELQLSYLTLRDNLPENIHDGIFAERIWTRGLWTPYAWPYYDIPDRLNIVEIIVVQHTVADGITWWQGSPPHRRSVTNPNYREIGVAARPYQYGTMFVAVLGGRPNVFPAMLHPEGNTLYLTNENFWGTTPGSGYLVEIDDVRLLDADQEPLTDWQAWTPTLPMPEDYTGDRLFVEYRDGADTVLTPVDLTADIFLLPDYLKTESADADTLILEDDTVAEPPTSATLTVVAHTADMLALHVETPTALYLSDFHLFGLTTVDVFSDVAFSSAFGGLRGSEPNTCYLYLREGAAFDLPERCTGPVVARHLPAADVFWYNPALESTSGFFAMSASGSLLADCRNTGKVCSFAVEAGAAPEGFGGEGAIPVSTEIRLVYNQRSLTILNNGGQPLDLFGLSIGTDNTTILSVEAWDSGFLTASLGAFPAFDCLQVWPLGTFEQPAPLDCGTRHGWISIQTDEVFWRKGPFEVFYNGAPLATCEADAGECIFELP